MGRMVIFKLILLLAKTNGISVKVCTPFLTGGKII